MKHFLKQVVIGFNALVIITIGIWGYNTERSETTLFWDFTGWMVSVFIIFIPLANFWADKLNSLFESYEQSNNK